MMTTVSKVTIVRCPHIPQRGLDHLRFDINSSRSRISAVQDNQRAPFKGRRQLGADLGRRAAGEQSPPVFGYSHSGSHGIDVGTKKQDYRRDQGVRREKTVPGRWRRKLDEVNKRERLGALRER